jgi:hypothetical protein
MNTSRIAEGVFLLALVCLLALVLIYVPDFISTPD